MGLHPIEFDASSIASFIVGSIGAFMCVTAYILLNFNEKCGRFGLQQSDISYHVLNSVGGILAMLGALIEVLFHGSFGAIPLVALEGIWGIVGTISLLRELKNKERREQSGFSPVVGMTSDANGKSSSIMDYPATVHHVIAVDVEEQPPLHVRNHAAVNDSPLPPLPGRAPLLRTPLPSNTFPDGSARAWSSGDLRDVPQ